MSNDLYFYADATIEDDVADYLVHYGTPRHSGRYPWGSGEDPYQRNADFLRTISEKKREGLTEKQIAEYCGYDSITKYRADISRASNEKRSADQAMAIRLHAKGYSNVAGAAKIGIPESTFRKYIKNSENHRTSINKEICDSLKKQVMEKGCIDIGSGVENQLGISDQRRKNCIQMLKDDGYVVSKFSIPQMGTTKRTNMIVLLPPGTPKDYIYKHYQEEGFIKMVDDIRFNADTNKVEPAVKHDPINIDPKRISIRYADDILPDGSSGKDRDGTIELRRGVADLDMGGSLYAQVRIAVGGTHYMKGMAVYKDDDNFPPGVDIIFNTNKTHASAPGKLDALKPQIVDPKTGKINPSKPFEASVNRQNDWTDANGVRHEGALNIMKEEGKWGDQSLNLASQFLSKQPKALAQKQLKLDLDFRHEEFEDICRINNSMVKKKRLADFSEECDAAAEHLKAAALPRQSWNVILPVNTLKDNEIFAPKYKNGERLVLVRYPHGGKFESPELIVNNNNPEARRFLQDKNHIARDAVGINSKVAGRLSGADFDGDTVLCIPNNSGQIKTQRPLEGLKNFDPQERYPAYDGMPKVGEPVSKGGDGFRKGMQMGMISNLITDMTIGGADERELAAAVRHSMVIIDAEKHNLDWKRSYVDNDIQGLTKKYQMHADGVRYGGAQTLISKARSPVDVPERKDYILSKKSIDPKTGEKIYTETNRWYQPVKMRTDKDGKPVINPATGKAYYDPVGKERKATISTSRMRATKNAYDLSSGSQIEDIYAEYANRCKALGNEARKEWLNTPDVKVDKAAKERYSAEVASLTSKLNDALKNAPYERQAQLLAGARVKAQIEANGEMSATERQKLRGKAIGPARDAVGASKSRIFITDKEWEAIQSGAVSANRLSKILNNADADRLKQLSTPRLSPTASAAKVSKAKQLLASGYTYSEIGQYLGMSASWVSDVAGGKERYSEGAAS
jgi:predicted transcriptional regulator